MKGDVSHRPKAAKIVSELNYHLPTCMCPSAQLILPARCPDNESPDLKGKAAVEVS